VIDRRPALLWLLLFALACTTGTHRVPQAGAGTGGAPAAGFDAGSTGGSAAAPGAASGAGGAGGAGGASGSVSDSAVADSTVPNAPVDSGTASGAGGTGGAPPGPSDASTSPRDATWEDAPPAPGCPALLPAFDEYCNREGLSCQYGMECCPDWAYCEFGRWTLLTHHCDACP
jgi:hypothetical protein